MQERSLVMIKPDGVQRMLVGQLIGRFQSKGLKIVGLKMLHMDRQLAKRHYAVHEGKDFFDGLVDYIICGPVIVMVLEARGVIAMVRAMMGPTDGSKAGGGTIRGDYARSMRYNLVHGSDSTEAAEEEIPLFFQDGELMDYQLDLARWS